MVADAFIRVRHVVTADGVRCDAEVRLSGDRVADITAASSDDAMLDGWLIPGFVDTHCHGGGGADFASTDPDAVRRAIEIHRRRGTTSLMASTVTASIDDVVAQVARLRPLVEAGELTGIHLEGPWLSPERKGAHQVDLLCAPDPADIARILDAGAGTVRMVTLAPELPGALAAARQLRDRGVVVAFGHSDADAAQTRAALDAGASVATHLFNAMRPVHHREPGPVAVLLDDTRVTVELICDGVHLAPEVVRLALDAAGPDRVSLVTDAMSATGCADGRYELGGLPVVVSAGVARILLDTGAPGPIAGSTLTMDRAFAFVVEHAGLSVERASRLAATNPARALGLTDVGELRPGAVADACLVDDRGRLLRVLWRGRWLPRDLTGVGSAA